MGRLSERAPVGIFRGRANGRRGGARPIPIPTIPTARARVGVGNKSRGLRGRGELVATGVEFVATGVEFAATGVEFVATGVEFAATGVEFAVFLGRSVRFLHSNVELLNGLRNGQYLPDR
eukprot:4716576-Pyramimonas_sp.AAC.1